MSLRPESSWLVVAGGAAPCRLVAQPEQDIVVQGPQGGAARRGGCRSVPWTRPRRVVWEVLTDYAHMAQFISNIALQRRRGDGRQRIARAPEGEGVAGPADGVVRHPPRSRARAAERDPLAPHQRRLQDFRFHDSNRRDRDGVHIVNSGRYTPKMWVPPKIGPAVIEAETQRQFGEIRAEILRRSAMLRPQSGSVGTRGRPGGAAACRNGDQGACRRRMRMSMMSAPSGDFSRFWLSTRTTSGLAIA